MLARYGDYTVWQSLRCGMLDLFDSAVAVP